MELLLLKAKTKGWITVHDRGPLAHHHVLLGEGGKIKAGNIPKKLQGKTIKQVHKEAISSRHHSPSMHSGQVHGHTPGIAVPRREKHDEENEYEHPKQTTQRSHSRALHSLHSAQEVADRKGFSSSAMAQMKKMSPEHFVNYMVQQMMGIIGVDPTESERYANDWVENAGKRTHHYGGAYYKKDESDEQTRGQLHGEKESISPHGHDDTVDRVRDMLNYFKNSKRRASFARKYKKRFGGNEYRANSVENFVEHYMSDLLSTRFSNPEKFVRKVVSEAKEL